MDIKRQLIFTFILTQSLSSCFLPRQKPVNRCNRLRPLFNLCQLAVCLDLMLSITSRPQSDPQVTPPPPPQEHSLALFSILGSSKTSEAVRVLPVERSQQPHDLINGDKHKPALTSVALRSNKDAAQVQQNKVLLQGVCVCVCIVFIVSLL